MEEKQIKPLPGREDWIDGMPPGAKRIPDAPTAAPGAKDEATCAVCGSHHRYRCHHVLPGGDCSCGWKAGALLSHDQAVTAWRAHRAAADAGCTCPGVCLLHNIPVPPGELRGESVLAPLKAALDAGNVAPAYCESHGVPGCIECEAVCPRCREPWSLHSESALGPHDVCPAPAISLPPVEVGPLPHLADSLSQVTSEGEAQAREATPASAPVTYSEGKKIYDQGWNDGVEQVRKLLLLAVEQRFGRR